MYSPHNERRMLQQVAELSRRFPQRRRVLIHELSLSLSQALHDPQISQTDHTAHKARLGTRTQPVLQGLPASVGLSPPSCVLGAPQCA